MKDDRIISGRLFWLITARFDGQAGRWDNEEGAVIKTSPEVSSGALPGKQPEKAQKSHRQGIPGNLSGLFKPNEMGVFDFS